MEPIESVTRLSTPEDISLVLSGDRLQNESDRERSKKRSIDQ